MDEVKRRGRILLASLFIVSVALLVVARVVGDPVWFKLPVAPGGDGILWQVQTTFLSVGFAGFAIAAQLFAESPLAIGASRRQVLEYIGAGQFVGVGLAANAVIAIETIWLSSGLGVLGAAIGWFVPTVYLLATSTAKLIGLFGHPSLLDEVIRKSLVESLSGRLEKMSNSYTEATKQLNGLSRSSWPRFGLKSTDTLGVPVPRSGVIRAINLRVVDQAYDLLAPRTTEYRATEVVNSDVYTLSRIVLDIEPGDRTRMGEKAFRVITPEAPDQQTKASIIRLLQSSIEFEAPGTVTPDEETDREIANLKDTVGISLRSGAFSTAERAVELLGHVVKGVWAVQLDGLDSSRRSSLVRRDWLFRSIAEVEQDAVLSPRAAGIFVGQAMKRSLASPGAGSTEYVDECLRSFTRIWLDVLQQRPAEFDHLRARIIVCVQNLAAFSSPEHGDLAIRATWAMVELIKLALDVHESKTALRAAEELGGLFDFDRDGTRRSHVRAGQLVLAGWLDYLAGKGDDRDPADANLRALVTPRGSWSEILNARNLVERGETLFSRWDWWETKFSGSSRGQFLELSHYIDCAQLDALAASYGSLPPASDQQTASEYQRLLRVLDERGVDLSLGESELKKNLKDEIVKWKVAEDERLATESVSDTRIDSLRTGLHEALDNGQRLADKVPCVDDIPEHVDVSRPILGMNLRIPKHYLVEKIFNQTYADPAELGRTIARSFTDGEERKIVETLHSLEATSLEPSVRAIREQIDALGDQAAHYVLLTPYRGLMDVDGWYSAEFSGALARVVHIETSALDGEAILFDRRTALISCRRPEEKDGLVPVGNTSIALGVFYDAPDADGPQVRIETGEYFVVWPGDAPRVFRFGVNSVADGGIGKEGKAIA
ncbi:hypothetical protein BKG83_12135 [Mycobacteroides chelonae]|uniref:hypothetical protein n=2 Tax=Mycobacteroides chelonae TaxID=1774 RepID=UPI0008A9D7C7|nr:hypothetical protein [Mycobacteroides chelonae]MBF9520464.1 hypothetical protein [Mycobacteroides chelonae]OHU55068.1 hypothetical protein BKG83_12135 [Mycobacteroides chelonae]PKQ56473.1 hypothetical protein B5566_19150 [Mycobacterium sp. MHSD3]